MTPDYTHFMGIKHLPNLLGDRLRALPLVVLYLTDGCNSRCVTCDIWRNPRRNMALEIVEQVAAEIRPLGIRWAILSGGEAMQHPHWPEIAQRLRAEGARVFLLTNGLLVRRQLDNVAASVDELIVSLDGGTPETYRAIRGVDGFDLVVDGMRAAAARGARVTTRTTVQRANYRELPQIIEVARDAGAASISFLAVDVSNPFAFGPRFQADVTLPLVAGMGLGAPAEHGPPAAALAGSDIEALEVVIEDVIRRFAPEFARGLLAEPPDKLRRLPAYFRGVLGESAFPPVRCNAPHTTAVIEVDGNLRPCYFLPSWGRIHNGRALSDALNDPAAVDLRGAYRRGERPECARCVCPLYKGPRALLKL